MFAIGYANGQIAIINRITFNICSRLEKYLFYISWKLFYIFFSFSTGDSICCLDWNPIKTQLTYLNRTVSFMFCLYHSIKMS